MFTYTPTYIYTCTHRYRTLKVEYYMSYFFHRVFPGISFPSPVTIAVIDDLTPAVAGNLGNLKSISPEEPRHALVFAIARDIDAGLSDDDLLLWKNLVVSTIMTFKTVDTEDSIFWLSTNARESVGAQFEVVYFSAVPLSPALPPSLSHPPSTFDHLRNSNSHTSAEVQRIFQFATYNAKREFNSGTPVSAPDLAAEYNAKVVISSGEAVTKDWAYSALAVYDRILKDDVCRTLVLSVPHPNCQTASPIATADCHAASPTRRVDCQLSCVLCACPTKG